MRAVAERLKALGFAVTVRENTGLRDLVEAFREFSVRALYAAVRLVFYAGHGIQVRGRNFLAAAVDMNAESEDEIRLSADVGQLVDRLAAIRHGMNILILDACRANPFAGGVFVDPEGRRVCLGSTPAGLARLDAPSGTLIAYSTAPGGVAFDGRPGRASTRAIRWRSWNRPVRRSDGVQARARRRGAGDVAAAGALGHPEPHDGVLLPRGQRRAMAEPRLNFGVTSAERAEVRPARR